MQELLEWYETEGRTLPWRNTRDPYKVLVSEIMLQQTQVSRVLPKYDAFVRRWPDFASLARADRRDVLRAWQGLGYNSRAARLHSLARLVVERYDGNLPEDRERLLGLPGIGPYTAGAVLIFAFGKPERSMDVNIERILRRVFYKPAERPGRKDLEALQYRLVSSTHDPHGMHSALMDLGKICTARNPACGTCPLLQRCKTRGEHPAESRRKQGTFKGSNRWWRGRILSHLLDREMGTRVLLRAIKECPNSEDRKRFSEALHSLIEEGMIDGTDRLSVTGGQEGR